MAKDEHPDWVTVKSTLPARPLPALATRTSVETERLLIRPVTIDDLEAIHVLQSQAEVMQWTAMGRAHENIEQTRAKIENFLPPNDGQTYNFCVFLRETGDFIGLGGCHKIDGYLGWPDIGYLFLKEHWGKGYASEFVRAFLGMWWALPRETCKVRVDPATVNVKGKTAEGEDLVDEVYVAITVPDNKGSQRVLQKAGFKEVKTWDVVAIRDPSGTTMETLLGYSVTAPEIL